jgi:hypothetical protein
MNRLTNPDLAAFAAMLAALLLELALALAGSPSLLAQLPPWLGPIVVAVAAFARFKMGRGKPTDEAVPTAIDVDETPVIDLYQSEISDVYPKET